MKIAITGGTGRMGVVIREGLAGKYNEVRILTRHEPEYLLPQEVAVTGNLQDLDALRRLLVGVDAVLHLAAVTDESDFETILEANISGTANLYAVAREVGVRRVVYASTNHVIGFYPTETRLDESVPVRPDTFYGVSKVFGEALASLYWDKWGIESVALRIGAFRERPKEPRQLSIWLSHRDAVDLVRCSLEAPEVGFTIAYGISANARAWWSLDEAYKLGYAPRDNAEDYAALVQGREYAYQGGGYADPEYAGGLW